jgi:MFS family permease
VVGLAKWLPLAVFAIPAGALADRVDRKRLMIACDAIRMVGAESIVVMLVISTPSCGVCKCGISCTVSRLEPARRECL